MMLLCLTSPKQPLGLPVSADVILKGQQKHKMGEEKNWKIEAKKTVYVFISHNQYF